MIIIDKFFKECLVFKNKEFSDLRGSLCEVFNQQTFKKYLKKNFVCRQINFITSKKNSLRGFHYQKKPYEQKKILRVLEGRIIDIIVDVRKKSKTYGHYKKIILSKKNKLNIYIPNGFAHGYLTTSKKAVVEYFCSNFYNQKSEVSINLFDKKINLKFKNKKKFLISKKDKKGVNL